MSKDKRITVKLVDLHTGSKTKHFATEGYAHRWVRANTGFDENSTRHNEQHAVTQDAIFNLLVTGTTLTAIFASEPTNASQPTSAKGIARKQAKADLMELVGEELGQAILTEFVVYRKTAKKEEE